MLIPNLFSIHELSPKGIIHIGAHECEERPIYHRAGVSDDHILWIEANPSLVQHIQSSQPTIRIIQGVIADKTAPVEFIVTNNLQSSSILPLGRHLQYHPHVVPTETLSLETTTLPTLMGEHDLSFESYDMLVMDIQGAEYHALLGMESVLSHFHAIYLEVNDEEIYQGCGQLPEVQAFLERHGFVLKDIHMTEYHWGDALFVKRDTIFVTS